MELTITEIRRRATDAVVGKNFVGEMTTTQKAMVNLLVEYGIALLADVATNIVQARQTPRTHPRRIMAETEADSTI
jgi:hypothetical protein